jgi:hypothetical protein
VLGIVLFGLLVMFQDDPGRGEIRWSAYMGFALPLFVSIGFGKALVGYFVAKRSPAWLTEIAAKHRLNPGRLATAVQLASQF